MKQQLTHDGRREHTCSQATGSVFTHWLCHHITPRPPPKITGWGNQSEVCLGKPWNPLKEFPSRAGQKGGYQSCRGGEPRADTPAGIGEQDLRDLAPVKLRTVSRVITSHLPKGRKRVAETAELRLLAWRWVLWSEVGKPCYHTQSQRAATHFLPGNSGD